MTIQYGNAVGTALPPAALTSAPRSFFQWSKSQFRTRSGRRNVLLPFPANQNPVETMVLAQFCKIWPIFGCDQRRIANRVSFLRKSNRFVLLPGGARRPS